MKTENKIYEIRMEMERMGGRFVQALSVAMGYADPENLDAILIAFPAIIERYDALATARKKRDAKLAEECATLTGGEPHSA